MTRVHAVRIRKIGGPDELRYDEVELGLPGPAKRWCVTARSD